MTAQLLDGHALAQTWRDEIKQRIDGNSEQGLRPPGLAVILIGHHDASEIYVKNKTKACQEVGIESHIHHFPEDMQQSELIELIESLNHDQEIDGILVQLPLPDQIDVEMILERIDPKKDVDGFHPYNLGRLTQRRPLLTPCTPAGIMRMISTTGVNCRGLQVVIVGASNIVGRPMALSLLIAGATVTITHRFTKEIEKHIATADILVVSVGKAGLIKGEWIKKGAIVIDVGINRLDSGEIIGDIEFESACERAAFISPVPGGVGPMTIASLLANTLIAYSLQHDH